MIDILIAGIIALIAGGALWYIFRQKRRGAKCIGCPDSKTCSGKCAGCRGCQNGLH